MSYYQTIRDTQKAARKVAKQVGKPAAEKRAKNPAGKTRTMDKPYAAWTDPETGWEYKLLKSWQADNSKEYGRWFMAVKSSYTFGSFELGDEYVKGGIRGGLLRAERAGTLKVDESIWEVDDRGYSGSFSAWAWGEK